MVSATAPVFEKSFPVVVVLLLQLQVFAFLAGGGVDVQQRGGLGDFLQGSNGSV